MKQQFITFACAFSFLSSSAVLMAELPTPPDGPVRTVDAVSTGEIGTPIWLGPAMDDGLYEERPSSLPTDLPVPMPNPDLEKAKQAPPGHVLWHNMETGETELIKVVSGPLDDRFGQDGTSWAGLFGEDPSADDYPRTFNAMELASSPSTFPRSAACRLRMQFTDTGGNQWVFVGSGHMIDAETVITAGHCVYTSTFVDNGGTTRVVNDWADWVEVYPGSHQGTDNWGRADSTSVGAFTGWTNDQDFDWDIGVIRVNRAVGMLSGWKPWTWGYSCSWAQDQFYYNFSFPSEFCGGALHNGADMYYMDGQFDSCPGNQLHIDTTAGCLTAVWGGQSGSAFYYKDDDDVRRVHAITSNSNRTTSANAPKIWESMSDWIADTFIPASRGSAFDLQALYLRNEGGLEQGDTVSAGDTISDMKFTSANATNGSDSGSWTVDLYLSTDDNINTSDTHLDEQTYTWNYSAMAEVNVGLGNIDIPIGTPSGTYWLGVRLDSSTDGSSANNETSGWDAFEIYVQQVSDLEAISIEPLTTEAFAGEEFEYHVEFANNGAQWTYGDVEIRASYNQIISDIDPLLVSYPSGYFAALYSQESTPIITLPDTLADGDWYIGMIMTTTNTTDGNPANNTVASTTTFTKLSRPANDDCEDSISIGLGDTAFDTSNASTDGDVHEECEESGDGGVTGRDIWYTFESPSSGTLTVSTCDQVDYDSDLVMYSGDCGALTLVGCNDDGPGCAGYSSLLEVAVQQGQAYRLRVGGWNESQYGSGYISISIDEAQQGDLDGDGDVDVADILLLIAAWDGDGSSGADLDGDGDVDVADLLILLANWS